MEGIAIGLDNAVDTLTNIGTKKQELDREKKSFDMDMKIKTLQLQKLEGGMDPELYKMQNDLLKSESKAKKAYIDYTMSFLNRQQKVEADRVRSLEGHIKGADIVVQDTYAQPGQGMTLGGMEFDIERGLSGKFPYKKGSASGIWGKSGLSNSARNKLVGELKKGSYKSGTEEYPHNKETAKNLMLEAGYLNYEEDRELVDLINKLPEKEEEEFIPRTTKKIIESRAEGLGRIGKGAKYGEAVKAYGKKATDRIIGVIQSSQREGKPFSEIRKMMEDQNIDPELFLKFYK